MVRREAAGYARNNPEGFGNFSLRMSAISEQARFPPAESPAKTIFLGLILQSCGSSVTMNR